MFSAMMRWVRVRGLKEGPMQKGRVEALDDDARDDAQRPQDYGFAAMPVDGEGLKLEIGGHTVVIRVDRMKERPQLEAYEVAVWHKEGHMVKLKAGRVIEMTGRQLNVLMDEGINFQAPNLAFSGQQLAFDIAGSMDISASELKHNEVNVGATHVHDERGDFQPVSPPR